MARNILLTISNILENIRFSIDFLKIEERFCSPLYGQLKLFSTREIVLDQILNKHISISIHGQNKKYFHGFVIECIFQGIQYITDCNYYIYNLKFASFLHYLEKNNYFRIFADKTIQEVIDSLLQPYYQYSVSEIQIQDKKVRTYIQYNVTDFEFLHQLFRKYHIFYFFKTTESIETIVITDNVYLINSIKFYYNTHFANLKNSCIQYTYDEFDRISATSQSAFFYIGASLKFKKTISEQWIIKRIVHEFKNIVYIEQHDCLISAIYKNKFYAVNQKKFKAWEEIIAAIPSFGVEKAKVMGEKQILLEVICVRAENKSVAAFARSDLRKNRDLDISFIPQKNQMTLLSFESECLTKGIILGGLFKTNQSWPFDMDEEGISIGSVEIEQKMSFAEKKFIIQSSGHLNQKIQHDLIININGEEIIKISQAMFCQCGQYCMDAKTIIGQVGSTRLELNQKGIQLKAKKIILN